jgi:hypothetical protein
MSVIINGDFQTGSLLPGWSYVNNGFYVPQVTANGRPVGIGPPYYCAEMRTNVGFGVGSTEQVFSSTQNTEYFVSFWTKPRPENINNTVVRVIVRSSDNLVLYYSANYTLIPGSDWQNIVFSFTTNNTYIQTLLRFGISSADSPTEVGYFIDDVTVIANPICYPGDTMIRVKNNISNKFEEVRADKIIPGIYSVINNKNDVVPILKNIVSGPEKRFVSFKRDLFGLNIPHQELLLTRGHGVLIDGKEIKARNVPGGITIKIGTRKVYSLVCENTEYIYANGMLVATFSLDKWRKIESEVAHTVLTIRDV